MPAQTLLVSLVLLPVLAFAGESPPLTEFEQQLNVEFADDDKAMRVMARRPSL